MITFFEFLAEEISIDDIWTAIHITDKQGNTVGKVLRNKQNSPHADIEDKHFDKISAARTAGHKIERGFFHRSKGFLSREDAAQYSGRNKTEIDSGDLPGKNKKAIRRAPEWSSDSAGSRSSGDGESVLARMRRLGFAEENLNEGNPLAKVSKALENKGKRGKTSYMATISADRGGMNKSEKREAHGRLQSAIRRHIEKGMLKMIGGPKQSGEYRYADPEPGEEGVAKEKSYVLAPGKHPKARGNFHRIMKKLGRDAGQESILKITQVGNNRPAGSLHYTTGPNTGKSEKSGRMYMNVDMPKSAGRTKFKNKDASIVVKKADKKDDGK